MLGLSTTADQLRFFISRLACRELCDNVRKAQARARPALAAPMITISYVSLADISGIARVDGPACGVDVDADVDEECHRRFPGCRDRPICSLARSFEVLIVDIEAVLRARICGGARVAALTSCRALIGRMVFMM